MRNLKSLVASGLLFATGLFGCSSPQQRPAVGVGHFAWTADPMGTTVQTVKATPAVQTVNPQGLKPVAQPVQTVVVEKPVVVEKQVVVEKPVVVERAQPVVVETVKTVPIYTPITVPAAPVYEPVPVPVPYYTPVRYFRPSFWNPIVRPFLPRPVPPRPVMHHPAPAPHHVGPHHGHQRH